MLQQTQVERVIQKYRRFLKTFPSLVSLARASLGDVLRVWQGLGYNRRAKSLHECARTIVSEFDGQVPRARKELESLPGVGPYTAGAVITFAWNQPAVLIETNIRSVYIHHFFHNQSDIDDAELFRLIERTIDTGNPREWYYALMDYGAYIKKEYGNPNSRSKHYARQSIFKGSDREIRGAILRFVSERPRSRRALVASLQFEDVRIDAQLEALQREGMLEYRKSRYALPH
jgi:A/G-specific adenine glycosylase